MLRDIFDNLGRVKRIALNEFRGRYSGQVLGAIWAVVQPLTMIAMYTLIFAVVLKVKVGVKGNVTEFGLFLIGGMLPFNAVADSVRRCTTIYVDQSHMLRRIPMPPITVVAARVATVFLELAIAMLLYFGLLFVTGHYPTPLAAGFLLIVPLQLALALGLAAVVASLTVLVRDIGALTEPLLTIWFLGTPVFYPRAMVPGMLGDIIDANPMTAVVQGYRTLILHGQLPPAGDMLYLAAFAAFFLLAGSWIYAQTRNSIMDHV